MEGRYDYERPSDIAARYSDVFRAPSKELIWFEKSAHFVNTEERDLFNKVIVEKILPITVLQETSEQKLAYNKLLEYHG